MIRYNYLLVSMVEYSYTVCGLFSPKNQEGSVEQGLIGQEGFGQDKETEKEKLTLLS